MLCGRVVWALNVGKLAFYWLIWKCVVSCKSSQCEYFQSAIVFLFDLVHETITVSATSIRFQMNFNEKSLAAGAPSRTWLGVGERQRSTDPHAVAKLWRWAPSKRWGATQHHIVSWSRRWSCAPGGWNRTTEKVEVLGCSTCIFKGYSWSSF